jgi:hypothetical protein
VAAARWLRPGLALAGVAAGTAIAAPAAAQQIQWQNMPRMKLEGQYAGPLFDTIVQRWRDPDNGVVCYLYLPITVAHTPPPQTGYVKYGANTIGSISCVPGIAVPGARQEKAPAPRPRPKAQ